MRILLTGGSGMVGRNILAHPAASNYEILAPSSSDLDLTNLKMVRNYLKENQPDCIIHAAGKVGGVQANIREPVNFLIDNLDMGRNIVMGAREANIHKLLNLGSSCMYPRNHSEPLSEEMVLQGELEPTNEGYALAKVTIARLCQYIAQETPEFEYKTVIPCNIFGCFDKFDPSHSHLIPAIIHKIYQSKLSGIKEVEIWGDGTARREFMFAADLADALFLAIENFDAIPAVMNLGIGCDYTIKEYYEAVANELNFNGEFSYDLSKPVGMKRKIVNIEKQKQWGWMPKHSLQDGIKKTVSYYLKEQSI